MKEKVCPRCKNLFTYTTKYASWCPDCKNSKTNEIRAKQENGTWKRKRRESVTPEEIKEYQKNYSEKYRSKNVEYFVKYNKEYQKTNWQKLKKQKREYEARIRLEGIKTYGGKCSCCGEPDVRFLTIEHLNRKPEDKRKAYKFWAKAKAEGYPNDYTVLCFNCNCAKGIYGVCPHQLKLCASTSLPVPVPENPLPLLGCFPS